MWASDFLIAMETRWGEGFALGGLAGLPFAGKSGFRAYLHHVPDEGKLLVMFAPHVGIDEEGRIGALQREGQSAISKACGAAIGASIGVSLFLLAIAGGTLVFASCCIFSPLRTVTSQIMELAGGNADLAIKGIDRPDEVGDIARAVSVCCANRKEQDRLEEQQAAPSPAPLRHARNRRVRAIP